MTLDVLLTRLEVTPRGELFAGFRNLHGVYFKNWNNLWVTHVLGRNTRNPLEIEKRNTNLKRVQEKVFDNSELHQFLKSHPGKLMRKYWWVWQIKCPVKYKDLIPKGFVRGHYTQYARYSLVNPGFIVPLDEKVADVLERRKNLELRLENIRNQIGENNSPTYATRIFNDLNEVFESYDGSNIEDILYFSTKKTSLKKLDKELFNERKEISDLIQQINASIKDKGLLHYSSRHQNSREKYLWLELFDYDFLKEGRMINAEELLGLKWLILDIEIPYFRRENPKITWVGLTYFDDKSSESEIHTVHNMGLDTFKVDSTQYKIFEYKDESRLISGLSESVINQNPDVVSAYNSKFDLIKLRETAVGFPIGDEESNPIFKVTTPFFERIGIRDRIVIDLFRREKIAHPFEINNKLEMAAQFHKEISYDELEQKEDECFAGNIEAIHKNVHYIGFDVKEEKKLAKSEEFKKNLEDVCWICKTYNLGLERVLHSANCLNDAQEREYLRIHGIYRDETPSDLKTKKRQYQKSKAREKFTDLIVLRSIHGGQKQGLFENVSKVYIPIGDFFREIISVRFLDGKKLFEYKDQFKSDKKRLFFLEQYAKELARWIIEDYGFYIQEIEKLEQIPGRYSGAWSNQRFQVVNKGRRILGSYGVVPSRRFFPDPPPNKLVIKDTLDARFNEINDFLGMNNLEVIAKERNYLYLIGNREPLYSDGAPVIIVDEIPRLWNADHPYYEKLGFYSHIKLKDEPDYRLTVFEMINIKKMLNYLLNREFDEAQNVYDEGCLNLIDKNVPSKVLIYYNKTKQRYFAHVPFYGKIYFITEERFMPEDAQKLENKDTGFSYFKDEERNKLITVDIRSIDTITPDYEVYLKKFKTRCKEILKPLLYQ